MARGVLVPVCSALLAVILHSQAFAQDARIAVAANFTGAAEAVNAAFARETGLAIDLIFGGTGALYSQLTQGAPFDAFLAADAATPARLVQDGLGKAESVFTYALGKIVLFSASESVGSGPESLLGAFNHIAIAEPQTAPYGAASIETLKALGLLERISPKFVIGQTIAQTYQFVETGNAELGFVALSQIIKREGGSRWLVDDELYSPLIQDAVLLSADNDAAVAFLEFLKSDIARSIIEGYGYAVVD